MGVFISVLIILPQPNNYNAWSTHKYVELALANHLGWTTIARQAIYIHVGHYTSEIHVAGVQQQVEYVVSLTPRPPRLLEQGYSYVLKHIHSSSLLKHYQSMSL